MTFFCSKQRESLLGKHPKLRLSTVREYFEALDAKADNEAGAQIEAGNEPYLVSHAAVDSGTYAFIPVHDIGMHAEDAMGNLALYLMRGRVVVSPDTLLAWR